MTNLFGEEFEAAPACAENSCAEKPQKKGKKGAAPATVTKITDDTVIEQREVTVKVYNETFTYTAPEDQEIVTIGDIRQWLVAQGFTELTKERSSFVWAEPEGAEKILVAGVKFEKQG